MQVSRWIKSEKHQKLIERWWILIVLIWDLLKTLLIDKTFAKYGVNPYIYFFIVVGIAVPYALSTAKMLFAIISNHWRNATIFGFIAVVLHFFPDIYILLNAKQVPRSLFDSFIVAVIILTVLAVHGIVQHVRTTKKK